MHGPMTPDELRRYAQTIVRGCVAFRRGDMLLELVSVGHRELAAAVAGPAYRAGAAGVDVSYDDARLRGTHRAWHRRGARQPDAVAGGAPARSDRRTSLRNRTDISLLAPAQLRGPRARGSRRRVSRREARARRSEPRRRSTG
jgi:hypothetical protein